MENFVNVVLTNLSKNNNFKLPDHLQRFGALKTNVERVDFISEDLKACNTYLPFKKDAKNDAVAVRKRENGNEFFKIGKYRDALDCYSSSIRIARNKNVLALAYANRSATLCKLNLHRECLADIDRALANGYPEDLKPKLIARQQHCKAQKIVEEKYYQSVPVLPQSEKNQLIECARDNVKTTMNSDYERCVEATRTIEIGDIIAVEKPFAVIPEETLVHCQECCELCYNMVPCSNCTQAQYCSDDCKNVAWSTYHKYECPLLYFLNSIQFDVAHRLALKMVFMIKDEMDKFSTSNTDQNEMYRSDRFKEVYSLKNHLERYHHLKLYAKTAVAAGFFHLIKNHTQFLKDGADENHVKELLLSLMDICGVNAVTTSELIPNARGNYDHSALSTALYSFFSLFNHSCWPNVMRQHHGTTVVLRAINTIKQGEQCFISYGPAYWSHTKQFRQNFMATNHFFTCTCRACEEDWPMRSTKDAEKTMNLQACTSANKLLRADVAVAREELCCLLEMAKEVEKTLQPGQDFAIKDLLILCYNVFGNKRRI